MRRHHPAAGVATGLADAASGVPIGVAETPGDAIGVAAVPAAGVATGVAGMVALGSTGIGPMNGTVGSGVTGGAVGGTTVGAFAGGTNDSGDGVGVVPG